ncbi:MAG: DnaD domain protein [Lactobacillus sp.]|nr:DnaD domain protein [Lactobacillus sp.]
MFDFPKLDKPTLDYPTLDNRTLTSTNQNNTNLNNTNLNEDAAVEPNVVNIEDQQKQTTDCGGFAKVVDFYKTNFGLLNSYMAEELRQTYDEWSSQSEEPGGIIIKAMQIALAKNVRNWKFVCGVLRQWEGKARTLADAEALEAEHKNNRTSKSKHAKPGNQKTMENFDDLANKQNAGINMSKTLSDIEALKNQLYG